MPDDESPEQMFMKMIGAARNRRSRNEMARQVQTYALLNLLKRLSADDLYTLRTLLNQPQRVIDYYDGQAAMLLYLKFDVDPASMDTFGNMMEELERQVNE